VVTVRDWRSDDLDWWVGLRRSWYPESGTESVIRHLASDPSVPWIGRAVAEWDGRRVGAFTIRPTPGDDPMPAAVLIVEPDVRGLHIGTTLWHRMRALVPGQRIFMAAPDRDVKSVAVLEHWGFEIVQHGIEFAYDLRRASSRPAPLRDISVMVIHDTELDATGIDVDSVLLANDGPEATELGWLFGKDELRDQGTDLWWVVARQGDRPVAVAVADADDGVTWQLLLTAVAPGHRRRGVARVVKTHLHAAAAAAGAQTLATQNEEANAPIRALNESLGYRVVGGEYRLVHPCA